MRMSLMIKEYPDGTANIACYRRPRELNRVRHDWTRIIPIPDIHGGTAILGEASK
jgi:hypothetical protein